MDFKKTYRPLFWVFLATVVLILITAAIINYKEIEPIYFSKIVLLYASIAFLVVSNYIRQREAIYWLLGYEYKAVKEMDPRKRKLIAIRISRAIKISFLIFIVYILISIFFRWPIVLDLILFFMAMILSLLLDGTLTYI